MIAKRFTLDNEENGLCKCILVDGEEIPTCEVCNILNELAEENKDLHKKEVELGQNYLRLLEENEHLKKQMQRLYNYFVDWHGDIMGANQFSEMWDDVKEDEDWEL